MPHEGVYECLLAAGKRLAGTVTLTNTHTHTRANISFLFQVTRQNGTVIGQRGKFKRGDCVRGERRQAGRWHR